MGDEQPNLGLPGIAASEWPSWYRPSKYRRTANLRVLQGRHPMGENLGPEGSTCGGCKHLFSQHYASTYHKCEISKQTKGPATDIRKKWRGCEKWEAAGED